jgi:hypothetical protein
MIPSVIVKSGLKTMSSNHECTFEEVVMGLMAGDFTWLAPLFESPADETPIPIIQWMETEGRSPCWR